MSNFCSVPILPGDTRYVNGVACTWHGPIAQTAERITRVDTSCCEDDEPQYFDARVPCCPKCRNGLAELVDEETFWSIVRTMQRSRPGYEAMMRWSQGKCFPDFDTLENAYNQAMEGQ